MSTKVIKKSYTRPVSQETRDAWKMASYHGMYDEMIEATNISEPTLRAAIKTGHATERTEKAINKFFNKKKRAA